MSAEPMEQRIGTLTLPKAHTFERRYETASWFTKIRIPAGEYPVVRVTYWHNNTQLRCVIAKLPGVEIDSYFVDRIGPHSTSRRGEHNGRAVEWRERIAEPAPHWGERKLMGRWQAEALPRGCFDTMVEAVAAWHASWGYVSALDEAGPGGES